MALSSANSLLPFLVVLAGIAAAFKDEKTDEAEDEDGSDDSARDLLVEIYLRGRLNVAHCGE